MSASLLSSAEQIAVSAARDAGALIAASWSGAKSVSTKAGPADLVTETDKACEALIFGRIRQYFPLHTFVGEEGTAEAGGDATPAAPSYKHPAAVPYEQADEGTYKWYVDPLDGTTNFVHGNPMSCVSIGLVHNDTTPLVGVVYNPISDELFTAVHGRGARLNGTPIFVSGTSVSPPPEPPTEEQALRSALIATEVGASRDPAVMTAITSRLSAVMPHVRGLRAVGSCALNMCYVACGRVDAFFEIGFGGPWDCAAGWCVLAEAGGVVSDPRGGPFDITSRRLLCAHSPVLLRALAGRLRTVEDAPSEPRPTA